MIAGAAAEGGRAGRRKTGVELARLHVVTDDDVLARDDFARIAGSVMEAGGGRVAFHVRGPHTAGRTVWERTRELVPLARTHGALLMVNDRVDAAMAAGAAGVHLGARSLPASIARNLLGEEAILGRSVHGGGEVGEDPDDQGPLDYLIVGTIFATPSHPERPGAGYGRLNKVGSRTELPLVAIGGMTPDRVGRVIEAGAHGVAVLRGIWSVPGPAAAADAVARYLDALQRAVPPGDLGDAAEGWRMP